MYVADDAPGTAKKQLHDATWDLTKTLSLPSWNLYRMPTRKDDKTQVMTQSWRLFMKSMGSWLGVYLGTYFRSRVKGNPKGILP
jgi:hypothetical protein